MQTIHVGVCVLCVHLCVVSTHFLLITAVVMEIVVQVFCGNQEKQRIASLNHSHITSSSHQLHHGTGI